VTRGHGRTFVVPSSLRLGIVVFLAGVGTLATEIGASRPLAPYFGSSTIVWANIIGLTLAYLALGYWLGGKLADRRPEPRVLARILLLAAVSLAVTPFAARPLLEVAVQGLDASSVGSVVGSFFAAVALFAIPVTALGRCRRSRSALRSTASPRRERSRDACMRSRPPAAWPGHSSAPLC
jgi:hypothetical protein